MWTITLNKLIYHLQVSFFPHSGRLSPAKNNERLRIARRYAGVDARREMHELNAIADEVRKIVVEEVRRAFREHENQLTSLVRNAVAQATPK
jgi:hypothetical protein